MTNETTKLSRSEQSRINGAKSNGPASVEGKAISSRNALEHGFAAAINNVIAVEDKEAFDSHVTGYHIAFAPQNYFEETLVGQLASVNWRQTRLAGLETAILDAQLSFSKGGGQRDPTRRRRRSLHASLVYARQALARKTKMPEDPSVPADTFDLHCLELVRRYITTLDRQYRSTILNLRQYRKDFAPAPRNEPEILPQPVPAKTTEAVTVEKQSPKPRPSATVHPITIVKPASNNTNQAEPGANEAPLDIPQES